MRVLIGVAVGDRDADRHHRRLCDDAYRRVKVVLRKGGPKLRYATGYLAKLP